MFKTRISLAGILVVLIATGASSASASSAHFLVCAKKGGSTWLYEDSLCTKHKTGAGEWELTELPEGQLLAVSSESKTAYKLTSEALGVKVIIECAKETSIGWIENPTGGGTGIGLAISNFSSCTVIKPSECTVAQPIVTTAKTELAELGGSFWDVFKPDGGTTFVEIELKTCGLLTQKFKVTGKTAGKLSNETSTLSFGTEMDELKFAGNNAAFEGESLILTDRGGAIGAEADPGELIVINPSGKELGYTTKGESKEVEVEYRGTSASGSLTVGITNSSEPGAYVEEAGGTCVGKSLTKKEMCKVKVKLEGKPGAEGKVEVKGESGVIPSSPVTLN